MNRCPIDLDRWSAQFDHFDPEYTADPYPIWAALRSNNPVFRSECHGGFWVTTSYEDIKRVALDPGTFSSHKLNIPDQWDFPMPPIKLDPPDHARYRRLLQSAFSAKEATRWEDELWKIANSLIDDLEGRPQADIAVEYARNIPLAMTCRLLGIADPDREMFASWMHTIFDGGSDPESTLGTLAEMSGYLAKVVSDHRAHPKEDLTSLLLNVEMDGERMSEAEVLGAAWLLFVAGIDTTWGTLGDSLIHLASHREDRHRLIAAMDDPQSRLWDSAIDEFLRVFAPASMARVVTREVTLGGHTLHKGDLVLIPFPSANRDPAVFERPDEVILGRKQNNHAAFGLGIHRCLGQHFAQMEMRIGLQTFLRRVPDFSMAPGSTVVYAPGQVRGPRSFSFAMDWSTTAAAAAR